jgi:cytidyltransferase-like protein
MMMRVYVDMVADLFHYGHARFLEQARGFGDYLIVGVHSDAIVARYKRPPILKMEERVAVVRACRFVDEVVPEAPFVLDHSWIERHAIDLVVHGDDFNQAQLNHSYGVAVEMGILRTVPYTTEISSSQIIDRILRRHP